MKHDTIEKLRKISDEDDTYDGFSLKDTTEVMEQITETTEVFKASSLLGKRNREYNRPYVRCYGCGRQGHMARENPSCYRKMKKKYEESRRRSEVDNIIKKEDEKTSQKKADYNPDYSSEDEKEDYQD